MLNVVHDHYQLGFVDFVDDSKSPRRAECKPSSAPTKGFLPVSDFHLFHQVAVQMQHLLLCPAADSDVSEPQT
jgi:hypothetical protein